MYGATGVTEIGHLATEDHPTLRRGFRKGKGGGREGGERGGSLSISGGGKKRYLLLNSRDEVGVPS